MKDQQFLHVLVDVLIHNSPWFKCQRSIFPHRLSDGRSPWGHLETSWNWGLCKLCECVRWISDMSFTECCCHSWAWNNKLAPELQNK